MRRCHICHIREANSREHLPGVGAANADPVLVNYIKPESRGGEVETEQVLERDGFFVRTLCRKCNSRAGGTFGTAYKQFVQQVGQSGVIRAPDGRVHLNLRGIQPLRVLKQMTAMFLAAQPRLFPGKWDPLRHFVLRQKMKLPAGAMRFWIYVNESPYGRIVPMTGLGFLFGRPKMPPAVFSELSWPPVGIIYAEEPHHMFAAMSEITSWGEANYKEVADFDLLAARLRVESHWPLGFGTPRDVDQWTTLYGVVRIVTEGSEDPQLPTNIGVVMRRAKPRRPA